MKLRKANSYEQFQWLRYRRNHNDLGLTLSYQFKLVGKVDFERLNHVLRMVLSHQFYFLLSYFLERNNSLFVGMNVLPDIVLEQVYDEVIWNSHEPINPAGDRLFKFTYFIKETEVVLLKLEFSHLVFDGECYKPFINVLSKYWCNEPTQQRRSEMVILEEVQPDATSIIFWRKSLKGVRLFQPLSFCYKIPKDVGAYLSVKRTLGGVEFATIHELLERRHVTLFQFIVAVTSALISRYKNREEGGERVVIAHTVSCRREGLPYGCYTNLIPLFVNVDCAQPGSRLLEEVRLSREVVCAHQYTPTLKLIEMADARANHGGRLFNLTVNNSDGLIPYETPVLAGLEVDWVGKPETGGPNDLAVNYSCDGEKLYISFDSSSRYMSHEVLTALGENFVRMAQFMALSPDVPLFSCDLSRPLAPIICGNQNLAAFDGNVLARVTAAVIRHGDEPAVSDERMTLTYQEMLHVVQAIRSKITACSQIESTRSVGIFLGRSAALPIAHLSALAALRTFVPMDPLLPNERLKYMVAAADVCMLLVDQSTKQRAAVLFPGMANIDVDEVLAEPSTFSHNLSLTPKLSEAGSSQSEHAAYILFTSGSTGRPKGVAISERNLMNFLYSMENTPGFRAGERMLALTPISFDISMLELLLPLVCGGCVHILSDTVRVSASQLGEAINYCDADVVQATPSTWRILEQAGWRAKRPFTTLCGGEALDTELAEYLLQQTGLLYNMYGPTEATIWASCRRVTDAKCISLGRPVFNSDFYILDANGNSVAPGMQGELVISGVCVGLGYLNTVSEHAFVTLANGAKAYKTGDVVSYFSHQDIQYIGRRDSQHKINGYRIDTAEISHRIKEFVPAATVFTVVRSKPDLHICSFLWLPEGNDFDESEALEWCKRMLPYYMTPRAIRCLSFIPLTANGKADLKLLSEASSEMLPLSSKLRRKPQPKPRDNAKREGVQLAIQKILKEKLDVFVADFDQPLGWMGLNSISYNLLSAEINQHFGIRLHSYEFYQFNSINGIACAIRQRIAPEHAINIGKNRAYHRVVDGSDARLAIIGLSVTMPGGKDAEDFWNALLEKEDCVRIAPPDRNLLGYRAGFLPNVKGFDARFFSISPLEATRMDPRQRLLMQATWHTLEEAGYAPSELAGGRIGCYIAATGIDYALLQARGNEKQTPYSLSGHSLSMLANRISAYFDWSGPSFTLDTACSGTLTALVKACRDLRAQVCDSAIVGGINLILDVQINQGLDAGRFMSPDQRCATFDESANGYVRGEGYGCFFVKRFADAVEDGDCIHAVIENVAENHGGKANSLTAPNPDAQYKLLMEAYTPELAQRVSYIETHGTGTRLGDPIEVAAIKRAWSELVAPEREQLVWLGAVKSNIGHLEPAAGIASMVKIIKAFEHQTLPSNLHFRRLNPDIDLTASPFRVLAETTPWCADTPLTAGVSSFGFGGANAHVVLSAPPQEPAIVSSHYDCYLVPVSARTDTALRNNIEALANFLEHRCNQWGEGDLLQLTYTLSCGREHFEYRQAWLVSGVDDLLVQLRTYRNGVHTPRHKQVGNADIEYGELGDRSTLEWIQSLYLEGGAIDWHRLYSGSGARRMRLPTYRFDEREYWFSKTEHD